MEQVEQIEQVSIPDKIEAIGKEPWYRKQARLQQLFRKPKLSEVSGIPDELDESQMHLRINPMPAKSAKQYGYMQAKLHGSITGGSGPSRAVAREFVDAHPSQKTSTHSLVLRKKKK